MPLTNKEKQASLRSRWAEAGQKELRGIWVADAEEIKVKKKIRAMLKRLRKAANSVASAGNSQENALSSLERHLNKPKLFEFPKFDDDSALTKSLDFGEPTEEFK